METIIQTVSFPFLIGLLDWWIGAALEVESWFLKSTWQGSPLGQIKSLPFQEAPRMPARGWSPHCFKHQEPCDHLPCSRDASLPFDRVLNVGSSHPPRLNCWRSGFSVLGSWQTIEIGTSHLDFAIRPTWIHYCFCLSPVGCAWTVTYTLWVPISSSVNPS